MDEKRFEIKDVVIRIPRDAILGTVDEEMEMRFKHLEERIRVLEKECIRKAEVI